MEEKSTKDQRKDKFRLWWEYLKRSEPYKDYCGFLFSPEFDQTLEGESYKDDKDRYDVGYKTWCISNHKEHEIKSWEEIHLLTDNYRIFGDVFKNEFDEWWNTPRVVKMRHKKKQLPVMEYRDVNFFEEVQYYEELCSNFPVLEVGQEADAEAFYKLLMSANAFMFVSIPLVGDVDIDEVAKQIKKISLLYCSS